MSNEIIKVLDYIGQQFGIAIDWSSENILPYVEQLATKIVNYEFATSWVWLILAIVGLTLIWTVFVKIFKTVEFDLNSCYYAECVIAMSFVALLLSTPFVFTLVKQIYDLITCVVFEEKIIFNYVKSFMRTQ